MAEHYKRNGWYWITYQENGVRKRHPLKTKDKTVANFRKNEIENKLALGNSPLPDKDISLKSAVDEFIKYAQISNKPRTVEYYKQTLSPFVKAVSPNLKVHQLKEHYLTKYINEKKSLKEGGTWHLIKVVNTLLNFCVKKKYITANPIFIKKPSIPKRVPECWTQDQTSKVLKCASGLAYQAIFINLYLGLRPNELASLRWQDIDFKGKLVTVREAKDNQFRRIPLHDQLSTYLQKLSKTDELILPGFNDNFMRDSAEKIRISAGMKHIKRFWYSIRHTFATEYYKQTGDLKGLQEILGHSKIEMTTVYVNPQQAHQHSQLNKLNYNIGT